MTPLHLCADTSAIVSAFGDLATLIDAGDLPLEIGDRLLCAMEAGAELFTFQSNILTAGGTHYCVISAQPTKALAVFMAAVRACDRDLGIIEDVLRHIESLPSRGASQEHP